MLKRTDLHPYSLHPRNLALLKVSYDALITLLSLSGSRLVKITGLPGDARILRVDPDDGGDSLTLVLEHHTFPQVEDGDMIGEIFLNVQAMQLGASIFDV